MKSTPLSTSFIFSLIGILVVGQIYLPISIVERISLQYGTDMQQSGYVSSFFSIAYACGFLASGPLSDRYGRQKIMVIGFSCFTLCTLTIAYINVDFHKLIMMRVLQGLTAAFYPPLALAYINDNFDTSNKVKALSLMSLGFLTASILSQIYSLYLKNLNFNEIEATLIPFYFLSLTFIIKQLQSDVNKTTRKSLKNIYLSIPKLFINHNLKWIYLSTLCTLSILVAFYILMDFNYGKIFTEKNINPLTTRSIALPVMFLSLLVPKYIKN